MYHKPMKRRQITILTVAAVAAIVASCLYLDHGLALFVRQFSPRRHALVDLPDFLLLAVVVGTFILWGAYLLRIRRGIDDIRTGFLRLAAWSVPLAFVLKTLLKQLFGRMNTRFWLFHQGGREFHWFRGEENYSGFPSGHMAVFTAFLASAWLFYPRQRPVWLGLMLLLGVALIVTDYHFLSDVLAGAYLGLMVTIGVARVVGLGPRGR
jgi:membrane-associated phospholipid phosphatase